MENRQELIKLFKRYLAKECSAEEEETFLSFLEDKAYAPLFRELIEKELQAEVDPEFKELPEVKAELQRVKLNLVREMGEQEVDEPVSKSRLWLKVAAVLVLCAGVVFFTTQTKKGELLADVAPGGNKAILTLADGSKILLDSAVNGEVIKQSGVVVTKAADGQLVYTIQERGADGDHKKNLTNTVSTPRGGQYQVNLPDGTRVWLNAASELKFPLSFAGLKERRVSLTGEAYFEVKKDAAKPFIVASDRQVVQVLGTHFNVNSYKEDTNTKTTLLEGAVKVQSLKGGSPDEAMLKPGQQARIGNASSAISVATVDPLAEIAWKKGQFFFENEPIENIMKEVSRWYDVDIVYKDDFAGKTVWGSVTRYGNVSKVLSILELTGGIHFKIEGRRIIVHK
ncbi:FecR family protein [Pedobacter africanus]|uniref:Ferric-dicitrate binding protein FerR (Iron transport regulator) n=1 Tax=Pedobacter africanus TaxID=151894 RepID=A0ACC6KYZ6_9SPHI|nr:FecR domain-containing protein [Pedobacter africanus]MDR6784397.1 ferric-dicitrate binding protein FerR (iron transport regulator) [Pedobacter africanus]